MIPSELRKYFRSPDDDGPAGPRGTFPTNKLKLIVKKEFLATVKVVMQRIGTKLTRTSSVRTCDR